MDSILLLVFFFLLHIATDASVDSNAFTFNDGFPSAKFMLDSSALLAPNGLLCLTCNATATTPTGLAFYYIQLHFRSPPTPKYVVLPFSTTFVLAIVDPVFSAAGTHGVALVISTNQDPRDSSNQILAVRFNQTTSSTSALIDVSVLQVSQAGHCLQGRGSSNPTLTSGGDLTIQVWVEYGGDVGRRLNVTMSPLNVARPEHPLISTKIDLSDVFARDDMYVGFSGATPGAPLSQYVLGWSFQVNGTATALDPAHLPKLPVKSEKRRPHLPKTVVHHLIGTVVLLVIVGCVVFAVRRKMKYAEVLEDWEAMYGPHRFSYKDLFRATKGFKDKELLGRGGFGGVYKGVLPASKAEVAVKRVSHESLQGMREFVAEIVSIGRLRHRNLVQLLGYCRRKGELLLVYDYMPNGSLDKLLFHDPKTTTRTTLDWAQRFRIVKGVASGLLYLHEEWEQVVVHRDVKASNVLLDIDLNGRLGDFGLAKLYDHGADPHTTRLMGTMGYIAPELTLSGKATKATDVFAFGIFLLEVVCGRRPVDTTLPEDEVVLADWVLSVWMKREELATVADRRMKGGGRATEEVELVVKLGLLCSHSFADARPSMRQVMQFLNGDLPMPEVSPEYWKGSVMSMNLSENCGFSGLMSGMSSAGFDRSSLFLSGGR